MKFRPCIDIHEGVVKQIVGSTLEDSNTKDKLVENFVSNISSKEYADMYKHDGLIGGHVIMLGANCELAAKDACNTFPDVRFIHFFLLKYSKPFNRDFMLVEV